MEENLTLEIKHFGRINFARLELNKINIIGGVNSSGKSTASRFLYCFLKANLLSDDEYLRSLLYDKILNSTIKPDISDFTVKGNASLSEIIELYENIYEKNEDIDNFIELISHDRNYILSYFLYQLIYEENLSFFKGLSKFYSSSFEFLIGNEEVNAQFDEEGFVESFDENEYDFSTDLYVIKSNGYLNGISNVFYIDTFSILDMLNYSTSKRLNFTPVDVVGHINHITYLINSLNNQIDNSRNNDDKINEILDKINYIIQGNIGPSFGTYDFSYIENPPDDDESYGSLENPMPVYGTGNTSSGIKQIGAIQALISKGELKHNSFLIIDEPEVNLHPEWQFKFAEILVLLAKELDIIIYLNSHSPFFIESIDAFTEFYDMGEDINYFLTEESEVKNKYNFNKITSDELYKIYDNLGNAYDLIDLLRLRKHMGE